VFYGSSDLSHFGKLSRAKRTITGSLSSATVLASALFLPSCSIVSIHNNVIFFTRLSFEFFIDTKIDVVKGTERRERLLARMFVDVLCNISFTLVVVRFCAVTGR
jgi:hypothetical protein